MLLPLYLQVAHEFADLHDRSGRMKAKGVIRDVVTWPKSREYFHYRIKRRIVQDDLVDQFMASNEQLSNADAVAKLSAMFPGDFEDDKVVLAFFADNEASIRELAEMTLELTGSTSPLIEKPLPVDDPERRRPDISLAASRLDWQPTVALREGLTTTIDWFRSVHLDDFRAPTPNF